MVHLPDLSIASEGSFNQRLKRVQKLAKSHTAAGIAKIAVYLAQIGGRNAAAVEALLAKDISDGAGEEAQRTSQLIS